MVKRLFSKLFTSKAETFHKALEYERKSGVIFEVDADEQWFVALANKKLKELNEGGFAMLILFQKQKSAQIASIKTVYDYDKQELFIGDFESHVENKGYGSILLRNVIELAKRLNCKVITGNLSSVDSDHFDKLKHIYEKFNFEVYISGKSGTIIRKLV